MSPLRWVGAVIVILGIVSLIIPVPHNERHGVKIGDVSLGVTTQSDEKLPLAFSISLILGGLGVAAVGLRRAS